MSLIAWLLETTGSFDKLRQGRYDEGSACGAVPECDKVKDCIFRVCTPINDVYGGQVYDDCINHCNQNSESESIGDMFCKDPQKAWDIYGYECKGQNFSTAGSIKIFGTRISYLEIGIALLFCLVLYIIYKRL